eukprot:TRINITY_DN29747_c0_g1_i1.p1 TRINITY_DN29747_c0_g1~~TRINITY_DN29747_c0_g1_i1.p1  ORF type:complete len:102 (+),score=17.61 TRINITY_DN29747_c0_g1_i1:64-369(+)
MCIRDRIKSFKQEEEESFSLSPERVTRSRLSSTPMEAEDNFLIHVISRTPQDNLFQKTISIRAELRRLSLKTNQGGNIPLCLLYTSPSPRDGLLSRMPSSA